MNYFSCEEEQQNDDPEVTEEWDRDKAPQKRRPDDSEEGDEEEN